MEKVVVDGRDAIASLETKQSLTEIADQASESQNSSESERLIKTHGIDSGIAESSDHSTADSPPMRRSLSPSPVRGAGGSIELESGENVSTQRDMGQLPPFSASYHEAAPEDENVLAECLEPRPASEEEASGMSPKVIQRNLLRKVLQMSTNGSSQVGRDCSSDHGQDEEMEEEMETLSISAPEVEDRVAAELAPSPVLQQKKTSVFSVFKRQVLLCYCGCLLLKTVDE